MFNKIPNLNTSSSFNKSIVKINNSYKSNRVPYNIISVNINWRKLPVLLDKLQDNNYNISKAYINNNNVSLFVKYLLSFEEIDNINELVTEIKENNDLYTNNRIILPKNTEILLYNCPYTFKDKTILEFSCDDRMGLLRDMIELLTCFPYEISEAYINTVYDKYANNIFLLQKNNRSLTSNEIEYISNVFEYEVKRKIDKEPLY